MTSKKQKERKKKNREEVARNRVLRRRETLRKQRKQAMEEKLNELKAEESAFGKQKPFVKNDASALNEVISTAREQQKSEQTDEEIDELNAKLEHNLRILEALEEEYDRENETRKEINQKLENEGHISMKEKMDALHKKALEIEGKAEQLEQAQKEFDEQNNSPIIDAEIIEDTQNPSSNNT